ncbi:MAG: hypothetical protein V1712_01165 [Patescibacteria group bacterium]
MKKTLIYIRHSLISHTFLGPLKRTWQSALAVVASIGLKAKVYEAITDIGEGPYFDSWAAAGAKFGDGKTNFDAARETLPADFFEHCCANAKKGVKTMFDMMADGDCGIAFGHSPVIEMAAHAPDFDMTGFQLKENQYIIFEQYEDGLISAVMPMQQ